MRIIELHPQPNRMLSIVADDGRVGSFDVSPYLKYEAFEALRDPGEFMKVSNGGYFVEWDCGADLSADTIEAHWRVRRVGERHTPSFADQSNPRCADDNGSKRPVSSLQWAHDRCAT
jgi:hypothetical protein